MNRIIFTILAAFFLVMTIQAQDSDWRYILSSTIPQGSIEAKLFNNLYTQQTRATTAGPLTDRSTFFSSGLSFLYGVSSRFNAGFDLRYRSVRNDLASSSPFKVLKFENTLTSRHGITNFGPKIRYAPFESVPKFSIQSAWWFPAGDDLEGSGDKPYSDWNGSTFLTQFFSDFSLGSKWALFAEVDFFMEDISKAEDGGFNRISVPATAIFSFFPTKGVTLYAIGGYSPYLSWTGREAGDKDYFVQGGLGAKYQFSPAFEVELLYTAFSNEYLKFIGGKAATFNLGFRYSTGSKQ